MTFILISGKPNVGKTRVCNRLHGAIKQNGAFRFLSREHTVGADHLTHYEKGGKHIVINSSSDGDERMLEFAKYLDELAKDGVHPDIIVTTIREEDDTEDINKKEYPMSHMLALLEKVAKDTPNLEDYYRQNIMSITTFSPTFIKSHAFVLHLEEQDKSGVDNEDKLKYAIDFILARP